MERQIFTSKSLGWICGKKKFSFSPFFFLPETMHIWQKLYGSYVVWIALIKNTLLRSLSLFFFIAESLFPLYFLWNFSRSSLSISFVLHCLPIMKEWNQVTLNATSFTFAVVSFSLFRPPLFRRKWICRLKMRNTSRTIHDLWQNVPCLLSVIIPNFVRWLRELPIPRTN